MSEPREAARPPLVFVSFARESAAHAAAVEKFVTVLRTEAGVDARIQEWYQDRRRDWVAWLTETLTAADFIIVIASPEHRRMLDQVQANPGELAHYEAAQIRNVLGRDPEAELRRILPVVLPGGSVEHIPDILRPFATSRYVIDEISLAGIHDLLYPLTGTSPHRLPPLGPFLPPVPVEQSIVFPAAAPVPRDGMLSAGAQVPVGAWTYVVQGEPEVEPTRDRTSALRQVRALRLGPPHHHVWLRQVTVDLETPSAREEIIALRREHELLQQLNGSHRGLPRPVELVQDDRVSTLVMDWPVTGDRRDPCGTLAEFAPRPGEQVDSWQAATVCRGLAGIGGALAVLHAARHTHRRLTPAGICWLDDWTFALRDLGDAARPARPGEGSVGCRAPEQGFRRRAQVGPWTDVFLLAAIAYHLVTGYQPIAEPPLPVRVFAPKLAARTAEAIDAALSDDPTRRPGMDRLVEALSD